MAALQSE